MPNSQIPLFSQRIIFREIVYNSSMDFSGKNWYDTLTKVRR